MSEETNFEKYINKRIKIFGELKEQNKDWGTLILGLRRTGKSTLAQYIAYKIWKAYDEKINVYIVFGALGNNLRYLKNIKHSIIIFDELGVTAFSRDFMRSEQKNLVKSLNIMSANNNYYIGVIQDLIMLDKQLRSVNFWKDALLVYYRDIKENKGKALYFRFAQYLVDNGSIQYLFNHWDIFSYAYYSLAPWTVNQLFVDFNINPHQLTYYIEPEFWNARFIKIVGRNEIISPREYKEIYRKNLELFLSEDEEIAKENYEKIKSKALELYNNVFKQPGSYIITYTRRYIQEELNKKTVSFNVQVNKTPENVNKIDIQNKMKDIEAKTLKVYLDVLEKLNFLNYDVVTYTNSSIKGEKKDQIKIFFINVY